MFWGLACPCTQFLFLALFVLCLSFLCCFFFPAFKVFAFAWFAFVKIKNKEQRFQYNILIYIIILVLLALAGYVFVEIYPVKIVVIAQTFRLLYLLKFFLLLLLGGYIGYNLQTGTQLNKIYALAVLISSFALPNLIWIFGLWGFSSLLHRRINLPQALLFVEIAAILS
jgi:hypothetical protein